MDKRKRCPNCGYGYGNLEKSKFCSACCHSIENVVAEDVAWLTVEPDVSGTYKRKGVLYSTEKELISSRGGVSHLRGLYVLFAFKKDTKPDCGFRPLHAVWYDSAGRDHDILSELEFVISSLD